VSFGHENKPVLQREFRVDETRASYTIATVILGIALSID
jgi:hypothetical protein